MAPSQETRVSWWILAVASTIWSNGSSLPNGPGRSFDSAETSTDSGSTSICPPGMARLTHSRKAAPNRRARGLGCVGFRRNSASFRAISQTDTQEMYNKPARSNPSLNSLGISAPRLLCRVNNSLPAILAQSNAHPAEKRNVLHAAARHVLLGADFADLQIRLPGGRDEHDLARFPFMTRCRFVVELLGCHRFHDIKFTAITPFRQGQPKSARITLRLCSRNLALVSAAT